MDVLEIDSFEYWGIGLWLYGIIVGVLWYRISLYLVF